MALRGSLAQPMHEMPAGGGDMSQHHGHHMDGSSDGAFHRRFDDAENWAKEFDKPERDAWQKPEEVVELCISTALPAWRMLARAPAISA